MEQIAERGMPTVLYVDDEDMARKYFGRAFGNEYRVLTAPGVDAALALLAGHAVDVLVTDYRMPGKAGSELLREVESTWPGLVRILVTAYADKHVLLETVNGGDVFRVLEKPVRQDAFREVLRQAADEAVRRARDRAARDQGLLAVEETVAFLAHELGAPLASIADFARTLARRVSEAPDDGGPGRIPLRTQIGNAVAHLDDNARYCQSVLDTLVDCVKRAAVAPAARVAGGSAHRMVTALLAAYPLHAAERAAITVDVQHDFAIRAAPNCVALVLSALLDDALRALDGQPDPWLRVTVGAQARNEIAVAHNGAGVPPDVLHRLLLDPVPMHGADGDGWGLIFCNRVMQSFGGQLRVQSRQGAPHDRERHRETTVTMNFAEPLKEPA
jgi:two-component system response regulator PhcR